jgi:U2 small nuclear ribonucleoprotein A'
VIQPAVVTAIPNLKNLVLAQNQLGELSDLDVLGRWGRLTHLVLLENPVTKKEVSTTSGEVRDRETGAMC